MCVARAYLVKEVGSGLGGRKPRVEGKGKVGTNEAGGGQ